MTRASIDLAKAVIEIATREEPQVSWLRYKEGSNYGSIHDKVLHRHVDSKNERSLVDECIWEIVRVE